MMSRLFTYLIEEQGKNVMVVMHSYGGRVGNQALLEELTYPNCRAKGLPGGVIRLYMVTAFVLSEGGSVLAKFGESPNKDVKVRCALLLRCSRCSLRAIYLRDSQDECRFYLKDGADKLYNDLPPTQAFMWAYHLISAVP